jgi:hypothetical protein
LVHTKGATLEVTGKTLYLRQTIDAILYKKFHLAGPQHIAPSPNDNKKWV